MGDRSDAALLTEELRIRVRDNAFEEAVKRVLSPGGVEGSGDHGVGG
jgi:hypothetical protein